MLPNAGLIEGRAFVESHRAAFEGFLQMMMQRPELKNSQLLHTFLTSPAELTPAALHEILNPWKLLSFNPHLVPRPFSTPKCGRAMKRGAGKLRTERGQHLSSFIRGFIADAAADHQPGQLSTQPSKGSGLNKAPSQVRAFFPSQPLL